MPTKDSIRLDDVKGEAFARFGEDYQRIILIASEAFVKMMKGFDYLGTAGGTILYMMGQEKGVYDVRKETETLRKNGVYATKRQLLESVARQVRVAGWGATSVKEYNEKEETVRITVENNPLVLNTDTKLGSPVCHYFRGYWAGVVSETWERRVNCAEIKCMGMGDKFCEFKVTEAK